MAFLSTPDLCICHHRKTVSLKWRYSNQAQTYRLKTPTLASVPMTRVLSSTILSLMEDRYLFSMILWVVLLSPSFTTPPGPTPPPPPIVWTGSTLLVTLVQWDEPCSCLMGSLSPPPIIRGTVVRMLLLISVWKQKDVILIFFTYERVWAKDYTFSRLFTGTWRAVFWMGVVRVVIPVGLCMVERTCVPSGLRVVKTSESVFKIWGCWTRTWLKKEIN